MFLLLLFVLVGFMILPVSNMYDKYKKSLKALSVEQERMDGLISQREQVQGEISYLKSDIGREAEVRSRFSKGKEGERMAFIIENESDIQIVEEENEKSAWERLKSWFLRILK